MVQALMRSSSMPTNSRSLYSTLPLMMVVRQFLPIMPNSMWPSMFSSLNGVNGL